MKTSVDFWDMVEKTGTCWYWKGKTNLQGYGKTKIFGIDTQQAHRISYILVRGTIQKGMELHHTCCKRNCVNPDHLVPLTRRENMAHMFTEEGKKNRGDDGRRITPLGSKQFDTDI